MSVSRRLLSAAVAIALAGCGGPRAALVSGTGAREVAPERVGERALLVVERPMDGHVAVVVFLDAGYLDGAGTALVAAEIVSSSTHDLDAAVLPDGIRFRRMCHAEALDECVREIEAALGSRSFSEQALGAALRTVAARRERGSGSSRREAETLAASAALGLELAPLGDAEETVTREDVTRFLDEHFGAERSLWIAVGDVRAERVQAALAGTPSRTARASRRARRPDEAASRVRSAEHPEPGHWAIARRVATQEEAMALANAWRARRSLATGVEVSAFPTRAGWVALVSFARRDAHEVSRWVHVEPEPSAHEMADETAWDLADRLGARWISGELASVDARTSLALVGRDAEADAQTIDLEDGPSPWASTLVPVQDASELAMAWALPGAAEDGPSALGATRIAAEILARRCTNEASIRVDGDAVVVVTSDAPQRARAAASRWRDCVALSEPSPAEIEATRRVLVARATLDDDRLAAAARALTPRAPGLVASEGSRQSLSDVPTEDVLARWRSWRDAGRWGLAGAVEGSRSEPAPDAVADVEGTEVHLRVAVDRPELVIIEAVPGCGDVSYGAALERAWAGLARGRGLEIAWTRSGASRQLAWGAISVRGDAAALEAVRSEELSDEARASAMREAAHGAREARAALASLRELARRGAIGRRGARCDAPTVRGRAWLEPLPSGPRR